MFLIARSLVVVWVTFFLGVTVYVAASFVLMRSHVAPRRLREWLREMIRETAWIVLTQPILPIFYLIGRKLCRGDGVPIVVVHGFMQNRVDFLAIARALKRANLGPAYGINYNFFADIRTSAKVLESFVEQVVAETGAPTVDLVCHSMGGLVALEYMRSCGANRARRVVTIATPHRGVLLRGPKFRLGAPQLRRDAEFIESAQHIELGVPLLSVFSSHDNVVFPPSTSELAHRGGRDVRVPHVAHLSILFSREVAEQVVDFLRGE